MGLWRSLNSSAKLGFVLTAVLVLLAIAGPVFVPSGVVYLVNYADALRPPSWEFPLGTDATGRSLLHLIILSLRTDLVGTVLVLAGSLLIGGVTGGLAAYIGGAVDELLMRLADVFLAIPPFVLAMAVAMALGRDLPFLILAVTVATWPSLARLVRGQILKEREQLYVEALRALQIPGWRILLLHMVPNSVKPVIIYAVTVAGVTMLYLAGLSYVGFGPGPYTPELGQLLARHQRHAFSAPWLILAPGAALFFVVLALNLLAEGLRDWMGKAEKFDV